MIAKTVERKTHTHHLRVCMHTLPTTHYLHQQVYPAIHPSHLHFSACFQLVPIQSHHAAGATTSTSPSLLFRLTIQLKQYHILKPLLTP